MARTHKKSKCTRGVSYLLLSAFVVFASIVLVSSISGSSVVSLVAPENNTLTNEVNQEFSCSVSNLSANDTSVSLYIVDENGDIVRPYEEKWRKEFNGGNNLTYGKDVVVDSSGDVYTAGRDGFFSSNSNILLVKYNSSGDLLWNVSLYRGDYSDGYKLALDSSDNIYLLAEGGEMFNTTHFVFKFNTNGTLLWEQSLGDSDDNFYGITVDSSNKIYIAGQNVTRYSSSEGINHLEEHILVIKLDSNGNKISDISYNNLPFGSGYSIICDSSDNIYVSGASLTDAVEEGDEFTGIILKYNSGGVLLWDKYFSNRFFSDMVVGSDSNVYMTGASYNASGMHVLASKLNPSGDLIWEQNPTLFPIEQFGFGIDIDDSDNIYILGLADNINHGNNTASAFIARYDTNGEFLGGNLIDDFIPADNVGGISIFNNDIYVVGYDWNSFLSSNLILLKYSLAELTKSIVEEGTLSWNLQLPFSNYYYIWNCLVSDSLGNENWAESDSSIFVDIIPPIIGESEELEILDNETFTYQLTAADSLSEIDSFYLPDYESDFSISKEGLLTNTALLAVGSQSVNFYVNDSAGNVKGDHLEIRVLNHTTMDRLPPQFYNLTQTPVNGTDYTPGQHYQFNVTIIDNFDLLGVSGSIDYREDSLDYESKSDIYYDFSYPLQDYYGYALNRTGNTYSAEITDLPAGIYRAHFHARDTGGNSAWDWFDYTISKATPPLNLSFSSGNSIVQGTQSAISATGCPSQLTCSLTRGGFAVSNLSTSSLPAGTYTYTYSTLGNENYSSYALTSTLTVNPRFSSTQSTTPITTAPSTTTPADTTTPSSSHSHDSTTTTVPSNSFAASESQLSSGYSTQLGENGGVSFTLNGGNHFMQLRQFSESQATLLIASNPITLTLNSGESRKLDINADNVYDLFVRYEGLFGGKASIYMAKISEPVSSISSSDNKISLNSVTKNTSTKSLDSTALIIIILCVAIAIIIILLVIILLSGSRRPRDRRMYSYNEHMSQNE